MNASPFPSSPDKPAESRPTGRWIPTPVTPRYMAHRPPALPWLCMGTVVLAVLVSIGATGLLIPAALALIGTGFTAWRWRAARALAARKNDQVHTSPGRHARPDEPIDPSVLVPSQRAGSPTLSPATESPATESPATESPATESPATEPARNKPARNKPPGTAATEPARDPASSELTTGDDRPGRHRATSE
jgi:hypothetical protein